MFSTLICFDHVRGADYEGRDKSDLWHYTLEAEAGTGGAEAQGTAAGQAAWTLVDQGSGPSARWLHSAAAADGRLWIFGGPASASRAGDFASNCSGYQQGTFSVFGDLWYFQDQAVLPVSLSVTIIATGEDLR